MLTCSFMRQTGSFFGVWTINSDLRHHPPPPHSSNEKWLFFPKPLRLTQAEKLNTSLIKDLNLIIFFIFFLRMYRKLRISWSQELYFTWAVSYLNWHRFKLLWFFVCVNSKFQLCNKHLYLYLHFQDIRIYINMAKLHLKNNQTYNQIKQV